LPLVRQIAPDVFHIPLAPRNGINAYLVGDVLVDTGIRQSAGALRRIAEEREVKAIALTHAHGDHAGSAKKLKDELGLPVWVGAKDRDATQEGKAVKKDPFNAPGISTIAGLMGDFPAVQVDRTLAEGDELSAGFTVLDTPGHSPGHVSFWRESDRVLLCGDVWFNLDFRTFRPKLGPPFKIVTVDVEQNKRSQQRLLDLRPDVVCFGHGPVISAAAEKLRVSD